jgi:hypothetical protein
MELYDQAKELILNRQSLSNNSSGTSLNHISKCLDITIVQLKPILNQLYKDNYIIIRKGINGELIFLKNYKK